MFEIKKLSYTYNSNSTTPFGFDCYIQRNGDTIVDVHQTFQTREEFYEGIEELVSIFQSEKEVGGDPSI